jgi:SpoVK/Ycf46/Vps4 family AAA+-type ATPase
LTFLPSSPGTGKTTIAKRVGIMFEELDLLSSADVVCYTASDFTTGYAGQSGNKARELFTKALGGVLFIDEAYRCAAQ